MSDERERDLERRAALGEHGASAALLSARLRRGDVDELGVEIAAIAGDVDAREVLGLGPMGHGELLVGEGAFLARACVPRSREREACLRMGIAAARLLVYAPNDPSRQWLAARLEQEPPRWTVVAVDRVDGADYAQVAPWLGIAREVVADPEGPSGPRVACRMHAWPAGSQRGYQVDRHGPKAWLDLEREFLNDPVVRSIGVHPELVLDAVEVAVACPCNEHDARAHHLGWASAVEEHRDVPGAIADRHAAGEAFLQFQRPAYSQDQLEPLSCLAESVIGRPDNHVPITLELVEAQVGCGAVERAVLREVAPWALGEGDVVRARVRPELPAR